MKNMKIVFYGGIVSSIALAALCTATTASASPTLEASAQGGENEITYSFQGCGFTPNTQIYVAALDKTNNAQLAVVGLTTGSNGCYWGVMTSGCVGDPIELIAYAPPVFSQYTPFVTVTQSPMCEVVQ